MKIRKPFIVMICLLFVVLSVSACGTKEPTGTTPDEKSDIFRFEDYESDDVFDIEKLELSPALASKCVSYQFTYLSDGYQIKGYLSIPTSVIESQQPGKCLLYNRGGNRDLGKLEDTTTANVCAACDRIVIASQYRGAGGSQGEDRFGGDDLHDVIKLIDLCEERFPFADMDDFCTAGVSRGGMMSYMAARQDSRIKRIIAISALSDLFASYEEREDMREVMAELIGSTPQDDPEAYEKRSAICWADEIGVPVLIFHSKQDARVSFSQAEAMNEKLKDSTFITYDDDVHGSHREDVSVIRDWLSDHE